MTLFALERLAPQDVVAPPAPASVPLPPAIQAAIDARRARWAEAEKSHRQGS